MDKNSLQGAKFPLRTAWVVKPLSLRVHSELIEMQTVKLCIYLMLNIVVVVFFFQNCLEVKHVSRSKRFHRHDFGPDILFPIAFRLHRTDLHVSRTQQPSRFLSFCSEVAGIDYLLGLNIAVCCCVSYFCTDGRQLLT